MKLKNKYYLLLCLITISKKILTKEQINSEKPIPYKYRFPKDRKEMMEEKILEGYSKTVDWLSPFLTITLANFIFPICVNIFQKYQIWKDKKNYFYQMADMNKMYLKPKINYNNGYTKKVIHKIKRELYNKNNMIKNGFLIHGPPGSGKSHIKYELTKDKNIIILDITFKHLYTNKLFNSNEFQDFLITYIREKRKDNKMIVIFLDEIDLLAPKRGINGGASLPMTESYYLQALLTLIETINKEPNSIAIGITNEPCDSFDSALLRPGRLFYKHKVPFLSEDMLKENITETLTFLFKLHIPKTINSKEIAIIKNIAKLFTDKIKDKEFSMVLFINFINNVEADLLEILKDNLFNKEISDKEINNRLNDIISKEDL